MTTRIGRLLRATEPSVGEDGYQLVAGFAGSPGPPSLLKQLQLQLGTDEELIGYLQGGEAEALTVLFKRHSPLVFRIAVRILRDEAEAEDAVQQVFLDLFRSADQFDPEKGSFKTWLLMYAYHRSFNKRRQLSASRFYDACDVDEVLSGLWEGAERALLFFPAEAGVLVQQGLKILQPRQRRTIELVYYEGLTAEEISMRTGESVRVVRHNLYRGLEKLRSLLSAPGPAPGRRRK